MIELDRAMTGENIDYISPSLSPSRILANSIGYRRLGLGLHLDTDH